MVDADVSSSLDLFGKDVDDLQSNVEVGTNKITGTLKYVTGYTGFSGNVEEQSGNYLVLHADISGDDAVTITVELVGGTSGPVTLDSDRVIVLRIRNKDTQSVRVTASKLGYKDAVQNFALTDLVLQTE